MPTTNTIELSSATLTYDVHEPDTPSNRRPLFIFGSPMGASGFEQLVGHFGDRTVITYDPRGMERSSRKPGSELTVACMPRTTTASSMPLASGRWTRSDRVAAECAACTGWSPTLTMCGPSSLTNRR